MSGGVSAGGKLAFARIEFWFAVPLCLFHIYFNTIGTLPELWTSALHWAGFGFLAALAYPASKRLENTTFGSALDIVTGLAALLCAVYLIYALEPLYERGVRFVLSDWIFSILAVLLALELARRTAGWFIPVLCSIAITYVFLWGKYMGGMFHFPGLTLETTLFRTYFEVSGMFGQLARISSTFVFMFILFGAFLIRSGAGDFVINMARSLVGRFAGGPGLIAVFGSALTGTVSGSAVANTVSTGVITIPLMKKAGFPARFAAGVEAASSTGGQIMPPIMGAGAFVMASYTQIPYLTIVAVSVIPALIYFASVGFWVRITAKKHRLEHDAEQSVDFFKLMREGGFSFLLPIGTIVGFLVAGYTPTYAAGAGILACIISSWFTVTPMGPKAILEALALGARNMVPTAMLLVTVGIVVMVVSATGIGNTLSLLLSDWAGGNLLLALILIGLASLVLGMGLPVTASYIVLGTLSAPALYEMINTSHLIDVIASGQLSDQAKAIFLVSAPEKVADLAAPMSHTAARELLATVPQEFLGTLFEQALTPASLATALLSAHMIIFWLSQDSNVTPPVCLAAFAAAAIARTPPMATAFAAWRIAKCLYIVPILFAYTPLLSGDWLGATKIAIFAMVGIYGLTAAYEGYCEAPLRAPWRVTFATCGVAALWPLDWPVQLASCAIIVGGTVWTTWRYKLAQ